MPLYVSALVLVEVVDAVCAPIAEVVEVVASAHVAAPGVQSGSLMLSHIHFAIAQHVGAASSPDRAARRRRVQFADFTVDAVERTQQDMVGVGWMGKLDVRR